MTPDIPDWIKVHPEVVAAMEDDRPVVALESAVITHGLPQPLNLELIRNLETDILSAGAQPATIAVLEGQVHLGLDLQSIERLALGEKKKKISRRDLAVSLSHHQTGGTTVAATMYVAHAAGVQVFATGGIGGVHRGETNDISADLPELARTPVAVVCSGAKGILDLPRTLEWLETTGVPVIGWQTNEFPAFFSRESGLRVEASVNSASEAVDILHNHWRLGLNSGVLICVPCPEKDALPNKTIEDILRVAEAEADANGVIGKDLTPFLLSRLSELSDGTTLRANVALLRNNARVAAKISEAIVGRAKFSK